MTARFRLRIGIFLVLLLPPVALGRQKSPAPIPNSNEGFDKQYKSLFKAWEKADKPVKYKRENERQLMERFYAFAIPDHWFTDAFGTEQGPNLAKQYSELFKAFVFSTNREFRTVLDEDTDQVKTKWLRADQVNPAGSAQPSLVPLPAVQLFRVQHFTAPRSSLCADCYDTYTGRHYSFFYVESFIYIDGAFRFVGSCDCPFWNPCSTSDPVFQGQLIRYPVNSETSRSRSN
jgi:hypothetical protein